MKKLSNTEAELKKAFLIKKVYILISLKKILFEYRNVKTFCNEEFKRSEQVSCYISSTHDPPFSTDTVNK